MKSNWKKRLHAVAGAFALLLILAFFVATVAVEVSGDAGAIAAVKRYIALGLFLLVPAMAAVGLSGAQLSGRSQAALVRRKKRRMKAVAANGLLLLIPCALALHGLAGSGSFGAAFYTIQSVELMAGSVNIALIVLNARDGLRLSGRMPARKRPSGSSEGALLQ